MSARPNEAPQISNALYYASLGWSVVPVHKVLALPGGGTACTCPFGAACISKGKHPAVAWLQYQVKAPSEAQLRQWFEGPYATYGVGIITGAVSGIFVIDVDEGPGKDGGETLNDLQFVHGDLPFTVQARTGGGGRHMIFNHPKDIWVTTSRNVLGPGVDVRGDGGFIVAAPSLHESGRYYLWDELAHPRTTPIADAPAWVLEMAEAPPPDATGTRAPSTGTGEIVRDAWGKVVDGRERHMIGIICGVIATKARESGALPSVDAVVAEAWPAYERTARARGASLEDDGRGIGLMRQRTGHFLRRAASGKWRLKQEAPPFVDPETGEVVGGPHALPVRGHAEGQGVPKGLPLVYFQDIQPDLNAADFIEGLLIAGAMSVTYGESNCGKTFFMSDLAMHTAWGRAWRGREVDVGGVIYCALEGRHGISNRVAAFRQHHGLGDTVLPFAVIPSSINMLDPEADTPRLIAAIKEATAAMGMPVTWVIIDTLSRAMAGGNENAPDDMGALVVNTDRVRQETGAHVSYVHHSGKDKAQGARGHSLLRAATDTEIEVSRPDEKSPSTARVVKQRELEIEGVFSFQLERVELGRNRRGKPVTSCVVEIIDAVEESVARREISGQAGIALQVLRNLMAGPDSAILPPFEGMPSGDIRGIDISLWRRGFYEKSPSMEYQARKKAFQRAVETLTGRNLIGARDPWVWLV